MIIRIVFVGSERIFLKFLDDFESSVVASQFFLLAALFLSPILLFLPSSSLQLSPTLWIMTLVSSISYSIGFYAYVQAIKIGETSLIAPLYNSSLLWLLIIGGIFLNENVTPLRVLGGMTMFLGLFYLYPGPLKEKIVAIKSSSSSLLMIGGSIFIALGRAMDTYIIQSVDSRFYAILSNLFIGSIILLVVIIQHRLPDLKLIWTEKKKPIIMAGLVNGWGYFFLLLAIIDLEVTVAEPASLLSVFVTAYLAKKYLKEETKEKLLGMVIMFLGAVLLFI
ncbi:MAG: EamA family transporter [Candidatus Heimdallarchaeota archaeon]|nr:EamA family transporter [Candidatus Heimdallarchaeota archaeon]